MRLRGHLCVWTFVTRWVEAQRGRVFGGSHPLHLSINTAGRLTLSLSHQQLWKHTGGKLLLLESGSARFSYQDAVCQHSSRHHEAAFQLQSCRERAPHGEIWSVCCRKRGFSGIHSFDVFYHFSGKKTEVFSYMFSCKSLICTRQITKWTSYVAFSGGADSVRVQAEQRRAQRGHEKDAAWNGQRAALREPWRGQRQNASNLCVLHPRRIRYVLERYHRFMSNMTQKWPNCGSVSVDRGGRFLGFGSGGYQLPSDARQSGRRWRTGL